MTLYIENHKDFTEKALKLIYEFKKVAGYQITIINIQKSIYKNLLHFYILIIIR